MTIVRVRAELPKPIKYVKISEYKPGDILVLGSLVSTEEVDNFNKDGKVNLHKFETDEGVVGLNGSRVLDQLIGQFEYGSVLEITYTGKEPGVSKDGKKFKRNTFVVDQLSDKAQSA